MVAPRPIQRTAFLASLAAASLLAGCGPRSQPQRARRNQPVAPSQVPVPATLPERTITREGAGPVRMGMPASQIKSLPNLSATAHTVRIEGEKIPALIVRQFGTNVALVELENDRASRIRVVSEQFATPEGVRPGNRLREVARVYGKGEILSGEGNVVATFEKASGMSFLLDPLTVRKLKGNPNWAEVEKLNPRVQMIMLVDRPAEEGAPRVTGAAEPGNTGKQP